jgi:hypothetical protein
MRALKILMGCASGTRARVNPLGPWRDAAVEAQLAEPQGCGWSVRTMKILRVGTRKRAELNHESCCERVRLVGANWQYC